MQNAMTQHFGETIYQYTRESAIEDGYLVDVTKTAKEAGFKCPVAITRDAWERFVAWTDEDNKLQKALQDEQGRLWDVLYMAYVAIKMVKSPCEELPYTFYSVPRDGKSRKAIVSGLKLVIGPGDSGEMVITIKTLTETD